MKNLFEYLPDILITKWPEGEPEEVKQIRKTKPEKIVDAKYEEIDNMSFEEFLNFHACQILPHRLILNDFIKNLISVSGIMMVKWTVFIYERI